MTGGPVVVVDVRQAVGALDAFHEEQLPFATALGLTDLARELNEESSKSLDEKFTLRTGWLRKGYRVRPATKRNLVASAYHMDRFMALQEEGGDKTPSAGKKNVAVPVVGGARRTLKHTTPRSKWPSKLKGEFVITTRSGTKLIAVRQGKRGRRKKRKVAFDFATDRRQAGQKDGRVKVMYLLEPSVRLKPRLGYRDDAVRLLRLRFTPVMQAALAKAMRTARPQEARGVWALER